MPRARRGSRARAFTDGPEDRVVLHFEVFKPAYGPGDLNWHWLVEPERGEEEQDTPYLRAPAAHFVSRATAAQALRYIELHRRWDPALRWRLYRTNERRYVDWTPPGRREPHA